VKDKVPTFEGLKSLPASVAILDSSATIVAVNDTWKQFGRRNGLCLPHSAIGSNYLQYCRSDEPVSRQFISELTALLAGKRDVLTSIYPCHSRTQALWFCLIGLPLSLNEPAGVALLHVNLTTMLPRPVGAQPARAKVGKEQIHMGADLGAVGRALEHSVLETLSLQLNKMFTAPAKRERDVRQGGTDQVVRTALSKRQIQVLRLLGEGKSNKEIATTLFLSPNTIKLHVSAILERLKLRSRTQAALLTSTLLQDDKNDFKAQAAPDE
jgi:DNA-binding CsgD family transcriptional regulator